MAKEEDREEAPSLEDTVRETYKSVFGGAKAEGPPDEPVVASAENTEPVAEGEAPVEAAAEQPKPDRVRDESGKFVKQDKAKEPEQKAEEVKQPAKVKAAFVPKWQKDSLSHWATLPDPVKAEIERREQDFHKGIEGYKTDAQTGREFKEALAPYQATLQATGLSPPQAVQRLMAMDHALRYGTPAQKQQLLSKLSQDYGINAPASPEQQAQPAQAEMPADPNLRVLLERLARLEQGQHQVAQMTEQQARAAQQQQQTELNTQIQRFVAGLPPEKGQYFETLKQAMGGALQSGLADSLESAFDHAWKTHPVTSPLFLAEQRDKWAKEARAKVEAAKKAAAPNVQQKGTVAGGASSGTLQDTIRATARELGLTGN